GGYVRGHTRTPAGLRRWSVPGGKPPGTHHAAEDLLPPSQDAHDDRRSPRRRRGDTSRHPCYRKIACGRKADTSQLGAFTTSLMRRATVTLVSMEAAFGLSPAVGCKCSLWGRIALRAAALRAGARPVVTQ